MKESYVRDEFLFRSDEKYIVGYNDIWTSKRKLHVYRYFKPELSYTYDQRGPSLFANGFDSIPELMLKCNLMGIDKVYMVRKRPTPGPSVIITNPEKDLKEVGSSSYAKIKQRKQAKHVKTNERRPV